MKNTLKKLSMLMLVILILSAFMAVGVQAKELSAAMIASREAQKRELYPAIIILAVAFVVEIVELAVLFYVKQKVDKLLGTRQKTRAVAPVAIFGAVLGLLVADLIMGVYVICLSVALAKAFKKLEEKKKQDEKRPAPKPMPKAEPKPTPKPTPKPEPVFVFESDESHTHIANPVAAVTVEAAEEMMSDAEAISYEHFAKEFAADVDFREDYTGIKKAEINVDTICQNFKAGERVTLNTLKEKKLISANAGYVKVLARGTLDKPLDIVAQNFSVAAVKMIILTGGSVVVADPSPEIAER